MRCGPISTVACFTSVAVQTLDSGIAAGLLFRGVAACMGRNSDRNLASFACCTGWWSCSLESASRFITLEKTRRLKISISVLLTPDFFNDGSARVQMAYDKLAICAVEFARRRRPTRTIKSHQLMSTGDGFGSEQVTRDCADRDIEITGINAVSLASLSL
jgi:hypothetical protein